MRYLVFIAAILSLYAAFVYVREMFRGRVQPNKVSWLLWAVAPLIGAVAAFSEGAGWAAIPTFMSAASTLIIFICSFLAKGAYWEVKRFDLVCGGISLFALLIWYVSKSANLAITFSIISDVFATIPTALKAWRYPETETSGPFFAGVFNASTSYFAVTRFTFASLAFPTYLFLVNLGLGLLIARRHFFKRR